MKTANILHAYIITQEDYYQLVTNKYITLTDTNSNKSALPICLDQLTFEDKDDNKKDFNGIINTLMFNNKDIEKINISQDWYNNTAYMIIVFSITDDTRPASLRTYAIALQDFNIYSYNQNKKENNNNTILSEVKFTVMKIQKLSVEELSSGETVITGNYKYIEYNDLILD